MANEFKTSGISNETPKNIMFGAGVVYKGCSLEGGKFTVGEVIGATSGGTKVAITPEYKHIEVDGALVKVKDLTVKIGETATLETNLVEITPELIKQLVVGADGEAATVETGTYAHIVSSERIVEGDYVSGLAFVGNTIDGRKVIVLFENALCTSGFSIDGKNKENSVVPATFECYANLEASHEKLPYHIIYPTTQAAD
mgnify:CR=1 FL=1